MAALTQGQVDRRLVFGGSWPQDLTEVDLGRQIIRNLDWTKRDLSGSDLRFARVIQTQLIQADLTDVQAVGATFDEVDLSQANLEEADFRQATVTNSDLREVYAPNSRWDGAFISASMLRSNFSGADFRGVDLRHNDARNSTFRYAILFQTRMPSGRNLVRMDLTGALLVGTIWTRPEDLHHVEGLPRFKCGLRVLDPSQALLFQVHAQDRGWQVLGQDYPGDLVWFGADDKEDLLVLHDWASSSGFVHPEMVDPLQCFAVAEARGQMHQLKNRLLR